MNIMNQLTKKHMVMNKKRSIMTILGVIVSVAMITAVSTATSSFLDLLQRMEMKQEGYWHIQYENVVADKLEEIEQDGNTENVYISKDIGYGKTVGIELVNEYKPYIYVEAFTKETMKESSIYLISGRFPETEEEILIPEHILYNGEAPLEVGDSITLEMGNRYAGVESPGEELTQNNPYDPETEVFTSLGKKTYQIVGIIERPSFEGYSAPGYTAITYLDQAGLSAQDKVTAYVYVKNVTKSIYSDGSALAKKLGVEEDVDVSYHNSLLRYYGVSKYDNFNIMVTGLASILIVIIMIGSISLIYNSFAISISERSKQFGMLASVGATKMQKRNAVFYEGAVIGVIAIPIGILAGIVGMWITFAIVGKMLAYSFDMEVTIRLCVSVTAIVVAVIFSTLTIYISALIPARRAAKISPIEAIRQSKDVAIKGKAVKTSRLSRKLLGLEGELALKNLKRNKKRYKALVFSLFISFVLFTSVGSYVFYITNAVNMAMEDANYDGVVHSNNGKEIGLLDTIKQVEGVKDVSEITSMAQSLELDLSQGKTLVTKEFIQGLKDSYRSWGWDEAAVEEQVEKYFRLGATMFTLDDQSYQMYLKELGVQSEENSDKIQGILINVHKEKANDSIIQVAPLQVKEKDTLPFVYQNYVEDSDMGDENSNVVPIEIQIPVELMAVTDKLPMGMNYSSIHGDLFIIVSEATLERICTMLPEEVRDVNLGYYYTAHYTEGFVEKLKAAVETVVDSRSVSMYNRLEAAAKEAQLLLVVSIFAYGFIALISLICMANLCNTISTSFALRRREFAMLKSMGMTPKAFNKMIRYESLLYGIKALLYGIPVSIGISIWIFDTINSNFTSKFTFPVSTFVIGVFAIFLVVGVAMIYASHKMKNDTIIDGLKSEIM